MAPSIPPSSAGPELFHAAIARHRETWARISEHIQTSKHIQASEHVQTSATADNLAHIHSTATDASSPIQSPADHNATSTNENAAASTASDSSDCDSFFSMAEEDDDKLSQHTSVQTSGAASEDARDSDSNLGSDSAAAIAASLTENRRIFNEGFDRMANNQAQLETMAQRILVEQARVCADVAKLEKEKLALRRMRAATERAAAEMLVESVPFSAEGRGCCEEAEIRRVAVREARWSLTSNGCYPRFNQ